MNTSCNRSRISLLPARPSNARLGNDPPGDPDNDRANQAAVDVAELARHSIYRQWKRGLDIVASLFALIVLSPLGLVLAIAIKLDSRGPALFINRAVGKGGVEFALLKFRSMHPAAESSVERDDVFNNLAGVPTRFRNGQPVYKTALAEEGRITSAGGLLRKSSLDELPQLWNVLRGDMSLVGPRPSLPREVALYSAWQKQRLLVKPGLTGLYQVTARNQVPVEEMIRIDLEYIRRQSFWLDLKILFQTPAAMLRGL